MEGETPVALRAPSVFPSTGNPEFWAELRLTPVDETIAIGEAEIKKRGWVNFGRPRRVIFRLSLREGVDLIQKPFASDELAAKVRQVLERSE